MISSLLLGIVNWRGTYLFQPAHPTCPSVSMGGQESVVWAYLVSTVPPFVQQGGQESEAQVSRQSPLLHLQI